MRIISGSLGGRQFDSPKSHRTHPMSDKVRGALFNSLGDISSLTILDAFAGSGALSFEAISRGANHATAVDIDKSAVDSIFKSAHSFGIADKVKAIRANVGSWSDNNPDIQFDVLICDPPFDAIKPDLLGKITQHSKLGGVFVCSLPPKSDVDLPSSQFESLGSKLYGDCKLVFYRRIA